MTIKICSCRKNVCTLNWSTLVQMTAKSDKVQGFERQSRATHIFVHRYGIVTKNHDKHVQ